MSRRICSILVTLMLSLTLVPVALAADDDSKSDKSADGKKKAGKKKASKKSAVDEAVGDDADGDGTPTAPEDIAEPDPWEAPPEDDETPPELARKRREKKVGDGRRFTVGLLAGYGFETDNRSEYHDDPFGFGFGLGIGYTFDFSMYLGLYFVYTIGGSDDEGRTTGRAITTSVNYMLTGLEVGYEVWLGKVILRPSLGFGAAIAKSITQDEPNRTDGGFTLAPGMAVLHTIDEFFIGGDFRINLVTSAGSSKKIPSGVMFYVNGGLRF